MAANVTKGFEENGFARQGFSFLKDDTHREMPKI
jgi:hypothetical protein